MDNTKFIQSSAKASFNPTLEKKCINFTQVMIITAIILMTVAMISISILSNVDAKPRSINTPQDICIEASNPRCYCTNNTENLTAECCVSTNGNTACETCDIDTETGDYVNCVITTGFTKGGSNLPGAPHHGAALGSDQQNPGNVLTFNPPNNAKKFVNGNSNK